MNGRHSYITTIGRKYQSISPAFAFFDYVFGFPFLFAREKRLPALILLAPPRSGSTLTYQLLVNAFENTHLTNIQNLLYATPRTGMWLSSLKCGNKSAGYTSKQGFVDGLCGEAEGLKFWSYWTGIGIDQFQSEFKPGKTERIKRILSKQNSSEKALITGYMGHVFAIEEMANLFPEALFVYLKRDLLSNAYSIFNVAPQNWFSVKTQSYPLVEKQDRYHQIAAQLLDVHQLILNKVPYNAVSIEYKEVCHNPASVVDDILRAAKVHDVVLNRKNNKDLPEAFTQKIVHPNQDKHANRLYHALKDELDKRDDKIKKCFKSEFE
ncbi:MAG: sulfotransferase [Candidatus Delongbacteria bacterium]|jgi:hypothetical protein|nr:sulfotransferase [Candidatus Delongbacteria bacterium]